MKAKFVKIEVLVLKSFWFGMVLMLFMFSSWQENVEAYIDN
jgi:hypothetical protein